MKKIFLISFLMILYGTYIHSLKASYVAEHISPSISGATFLRNGQLATCQSTEENNLREKRSRVLHDSSSYEKMTHHKNNIIRHSNNDLYLHEINAHESELQPILTEVKEVAVSKEHIVVLHHNNTIDMYDGAYQKIQAIIPDSTTTAISLSPEGTLLSLGDADGIVSFYTLKNTVFSKTHEHKVATQAITHLATSATNSVAAAHTCDKISVMHTQVPDAPIQVISVAIDKSNVSSLAFSPADNTLIAGDSEGRIHLFAPTNDALYRKKELITVDEDEIIHLEMSSANDIIATGKRSISLFRAPTVLTVTVLPQCPVICAGQSVTLTANVENGTPASYAWTPGGETTASITVNTPGLYTVEVTDTLGNIAQGYACVSAGDIDVILIANPTSVCAGSSPELSAYIIDGTPPYTVSFSDGTNTFCTQTGVTANPVICTTAPGITGVTNYTATVTDANGCTATSNIVTVTPLPQPTVTITSAIPNCDGTISIIGTIQPAGLYGLSVFNGAMQIAVPEIVTTIGPAFNFAIQTDLPLPAGTYAGLTLHTLDQATGCTIVTPLPPVTINNPLLLSLTPSPLALICQDIDYTITSTVSGGAGSYTYNWTTNALAGIQPPTNQPTYTIVNPQVLNGGTYTLTVTDSAGCVVSASVSIIVDGLGISLSASPANICGTSFPTTTTLTAALSSGIPPYSVEFFQGTPPTGTSLGTDATPPYSLVVTPPVQPTGPSTVTYYAVVTDGNNCVSTSNVVTVNVNNPATPTGTAVFNCNKTVTITGTATAGNTITVFNGATQIGGPIVVPGTGNYSVTTSVLATGSYTLTVRATNNFGCFVEISVPVIVYDTLTASITPSSTVPVCQGDNQTLTANPLGGSGNYAYQWFFPNASTPIGGATNQTYTITNALPANSGTYFVRVTDTTTGCTVTPSVQVVVTECILTGRQVICFNQGTGVLTVTIIDAINPPYTVNLFEDGTQIQSVTTNSHTAQFTIGPNIVPHTYHAEVIDSTGCTVASNNLIVAISQVTAPTVTSTIVNCDGTVTITGTADAGTTITVVNNSTLEQVAVPVIAAGNNTYSITTVALPLGSYILNVVSTNSDCCFAQVATNITVTEPFITTLSGPTILCQGSTLTINSSAANGVPPYTYTWSGPNPARTLPATPSISLTNLTAADAGLYSLTISDSHIPACSITESICVSITTLGVSLTAQQPIVCSGQASTLIGTIYGGIAPYTATFSDGTIIPNITGTTFTHVVNPTVTTGYSVTITDSTPPNGCSATAAVNVSVKNIDVTLLACPEELCTRQDATLTTFIDGITPPYTLAFSDGFTATTSDSVYTRVVTPVTTTTYTVTATSTTGCTGTSNPVTISFTSSIIPIIDQAMPNCEGLVVITGTTDPGAIISATIVGQPVAIPVVAKADGSFILQTIVLSNGTYDITITATNSIGCFASTTVQVVVDCSPLTIVITDPRCSVSDPRPVITGLTMPHTIVEIYANNVLLGTTISDATGAFFFIPQLPLADGRYEIYATTRAIDGKLAASNTIIVIVDTVLKNVTPQAIVNKYCPAC